MYYSTSAEIIIAIVVIMLIIKPLLKIVVDVFGKVFKEDHDSKE